MQIKWFSHKSNSLVRQSAQLLSKLVRAPDQLKVNGICLYCVRNRSDRTGCSAVLQAQEGASLADSISLSAAIDLEIRYECTEMHPDSVPAEIKASSNEFALIEVGRSKCAVCPQEKSKEWIST